MTAFSAAALAAECQTIHHLALSAATNIDESVAKWNASDSPPTQVSANLKELGATVSELGEKLGSSKMISERLQHTLADRLEQCDCGVSIVNHSTRLSDAQQLPIDAGLLSKYESWLGLEISVMQGLVEAIQV